MLFSLRMSLWHKIPTASSLSTPCTVLYLGNRPCNMVNSSQGKIKCLQLCSSTHCQFLENNWRHAYQTNIAELSTWGYFVHRIPLTLPSTRSDMPHSLFITKLCSQQCWTNQRALLTHYVNNGAQCRPISMFKMASVLRFRIFHRQWSSFHSSGRICTNSIINWLIFLWKRAT